MYAGGEGFTFLRAVASSVVLTQVYYLPPNLCSQKHPQLNATGHVCALIPTCTHREREESRKEHVMGRKYDQSVYMQVYVIMREVIKNTDLEVQMAVPISIMKVE
jgi:hypothetical protein